MPVADYARIVRVGGEARVHLGDGAMHVFDEGVDPVPGHEGVIRRDAGLAGVEQLAEGEARRYRGEVAGRIEDRRRFAAQLQGHRRQVLRCRLGHHSSDGGGAGEEQVVERQFGESLAGLGIADHYRHFVLGEELGHDALQQFGKSRRQLRRLDHDPVAGGDGRYRGRDGQLIGVVPGRDDAHHAQRLAHQAVAGGEVLHGGGHAPRLHPALEMALRMADGPADQNEFGHLRFVGRTVAEVGADRLDDLRRMLFAHRREPGQAIPAHCERRIHLPGKGRSLAFQDVEQRSDVRIVHIASSYRR